MRVIGGKSGFKSVRDLLFFFAGLTICFYHFFSTPPGDLSVPVLLFGGGLAGCPAFLRQDEKRYEKKE